MKCRYCGSEIPEGMVYCEQCGKELCIVPEYNPLDDMLTAQVKVAINEDSDTMDRPNNSNNRRTSSMGRNTGRNTTGNLSEREQRRRKAERKKALKKKRRKKALLILGIVIALIAVISIVVYQNSYTGIVNKGYKAEQKKEYAKAEEYFQKAVRKNEKKAEAYVGLAKILVSQDDVETAEGVFTDALEGQPNNADIYEACVQFYIDTDQKMKIPVFLDDAASNVRKALSGYVIEGPSFSLDEEEEYDDVQQLALESNESYELYYTTDGNDPTTKSAKYTEPIQLEEGENTIIAIAVNKKGIPSLPVRKTYQIELPVEDAPAVSPSTGQYDTATQIEIKVPDGYTAYYTLDRSDPTSAATKYEGPIDMPAGETIFKAVLINGKGKESGITTRNYLYEE